MDLFDLTWASSDAYSLSGNSYKIIIYKPFAKRPYGLRIHTHIYTVLENRERVRQPQSVEISEHY